MTLRDKIGTIFGVHLGEDYNLLRYFQELNIRGSFDLKKTMEIIVMLVVDVEELQKRQVDMSRRLAELQPKVVEVKVADELPPVVATITQTETTVINEPEPVPVVVETPPEPAVTGVAPEPQIDPAQETPTT